MNNFFEILKKDIKLIFSKKMLFLLISPLILYSLYINFVYSKQDLKPHSIYLLDENNEVKGEDKNIFPVESLEELKTKITKDKKGIGVVISDNEMFLNYYSTNSETNDNLKERYVLSKLNEKSDIKTRVIGNYNREEKLRREMTSEVLFFEIVGIVFMGATSIILKEKNMGTLKIHNTLPFKGFSLIVSKSLIFFAINLVISVILIGTNIGHKYMFSITKNAWIHIGIMSLIITLFSYICGVIFKDLKQFGLFYAFVMVFLTSPIFLIANTPIYWDWIEYYPIYFIYFALKNAHFEIVTSNWQYYVNSILGISLLTVITTYLVKKKSAEE